MSGTWKRTIKKDRVEIAISPFRRFTAAETKSLKEPADEYGRFVDLPAKLEV